MLTLEEILDYIDEIINAEAEIPREATHAERAIATGVILAMEDLKEWVTKRWEKQ